MTSAQCGHQLRRECLRLAEPFDFDLAAERLIARRMRSRRVCLPARARIRPARCRLALAIERHLRCHGNLDAQASPAASPASTRTADSAPAVTLILQLRGRVAGLLGADSIVARPQQEAIAERHRGQRAVDARRSRCAGSVAHADRGRGEDEPQHAGDERARARRATIRAGLNENCRRGVARRTRESAPRRSARLRRRSRRCTRAIVRDDRRRGDVAAAAVVDFDDALAVAARVTRRRAAPKIHHVARFQPGRALHRARRCAVPRAPSAGCTNS